MKNYKITYSGNATRFKNTNEIVSAKSQREAVENHYKRVLDDNYFPMGNGVILDCDGEIVAHKDYINFCYDGGYFNAELVVNETEKMFRLMNHDSSHTVPKFDSYTIQEHNEQFDTKYKSVEEAVNTDCEYLFTDEQMEMYLS